MRRSESGFTLIELLTVISIIGILSTLAITSFKVYRSTAAYSSSETTLHNAIVASEAGLIDPDNPPAGVALYSQTTQGPMLSATAAALLPGLMIPRKLRFEVSFDPDCINGACLSQYMRASHCQAEKHVQFTRFGDGSILYLDNLLGGGC